MPLVTLVPLSERVRVGDLDVDLQWQTVRRAGEEIELPDLSFRLLAALIHRAPEKMTKDDLIAEVWEGVVVSDETLTQRVKLLRQSLGDDGRSPKYVVSVRGHGYRLGCDVEDNPAQPPRPAGSTTLWKLVGTAALLLAGIAWLVFFIGWQGDRNATPGSVAVLPFDDLSAGGNYRHFADGMQEELLTRLASLGQLGVISRTSTEQFRGTSLSIPEIGSALDAEAIIEGSVRIDGDNLRVTVQLIDAGSDTHLWADSFDRTLSVENLIVVQDEVADRVADALARQYRSDQDEPVAVPTHSLDAYDAYLLGRHHVFQQTPEDLELGIAHLERATAIDSDFAEAYAALGWAWSFLGTSYYGNQPPGVVYPRAKQAALHALSLKPELADARSLFADILTWFDWDFEAAEREYRKTMTLDPLNVLGYALFLSTQRRHDEAIALVEMRVNDNPADTYSQLNAAWRYLNAGMLEKAIAAAEAAKGHPDANSALAFSLLAAGQTERAIEIFEVDAARRGRNPAQLSNLAVGYFEAGRTDEARATLAELERLAEKTYVSAALFAAAYFAAGDADAGFELMQAAVSERAREVVFLQVGQAIQHYRDDPRYAALVRRVGFP